MTDHKAMSIDHGLREKRNTCRLKKEAYEGEEKGRRKRRRGRKRKERLVIKSASQRRLANYEARHSTFPRRTLADD